MRPPQGSPLSPVLYMLYLAELLNQDQALRFGYADDIALYRIGNTLEENVTAITQDVRRIEAWGLANKVAFAPEKLEMMHFTRRRHAHAPEAVISPTLTIQPTTSAPGDTKQPALRWLGVWLDRKLTFKRHIAETSREGTESGIAHQAPCQYRAWPPCSLPTESHDHMRNALATLRGRSVVSGTNAAKYRRRPSTRHHGEHSNGVTHSEG
ncbi:hypothetical protein DID88_009966 [Monilinia fructigena]|uniref:Reverse transcriptase domain-containing protein n=1 Tax=Monilinia fructigena TaxID=38457 RepID=A0A395IM76_9HELO|nr:hypothetical protein DID88_009966 [Monilinia fructigena]